MRAIHYIAAAQRSVDRPSGCDYLRRTGQGLSHPRLHITVKEHISLFPQTKVEMAKIARSRGECMHACQIITCPARPLPIHVKCVCWTVNIAICMFVHILLFRQ